MAIANPCSFATSSFQGSCAPAGAPASRAMSSVAASSLGFMQLPPYPHIPFPSQFTLPGGCTCRRRLDAFLGGPRSQLDGVGEAGEHRMRAAEVPPGAGVGGDDHL